MSDTILAVGWALEQPEIACYPDRYHTVRAEYTRLLDAWIAAQGGEEAVLDRAKAHFAALTRQLEAA